MTRSTFKEFMGHYRWARRGSMIRRPMSIWRSLWLAFVCTFFPSTGEAEEMTISDKVWNRDRDE